MRRRPRSVLVASVLVVLGALFAVIPATAPWAWSSASRRRCRP
ncbi:hypothetical protein ACFQV8_05695 [Pseudonocardia benzenivorans]